MSHPETQISTASQKPKNEIEEVGDIEEYYEEVDENDEDLLNEKKQSQVSMEEREELIKKNKTKLEKLLAQPDIFDCLRRINSGEIKSYDELDTMN